MKSYLFLIILFTGYTALSQNALETELRNLEETERLAMLKRDSVTLLKIWAPDLTCNTPINRITFSRREVLDLISKGIFNFSSFERSIEKIFIKDNVAFIMGNETVVPVNNSPKAGQTIRRRYTNIWLKQDGKWILTARHANEICGS